MKLRNKKTGEIVDNWAFISARYDSLAEMIEEWEDYEPKEPLIKDEKIRKAIRAWAEALGTDEVRYNSCAEYSDGRFEAEMGIADIDFGRALELEDENYTIAELCGEEE